MEINGQIKIGCCILDKIKHQHVNQPTYILIDVKISTNESKEKYGIAFSL
jgi:hypothetical protein